MMRGRHLRDDELPSEGVPITDELTSPSLKSSMPPLAKDPRDRYAGSGEGAGDMRSYDREGGRGRGREGDRDPYRDVDRRGDRSERDRYASSKNSSGGGNNPYATNLPPRLQRQAEMQERYQRDQQQTSSGGPGGVPSRGSGSGASQQQPRSERYSIDDGQPVRGMMIMRQSDRSADDLFEARGGERRDRSDRGGDRRTPEDASASRGASNARSEGVTSWRNSKRDQPQSEVPQQGRRDSQQLDSLSKSSSSEAVSAQSTVPQPTQPTNVTAVEQQVSSSTEKTFSESSTAKEIADGPERRLVFYLLF